MELLKTKLPQKKKDGREDVNELISALKAQRDDLNAILELMDRRISTLERGGR